jgi:hypothetical protein
MTSQIDSVGENETTGENEPVSDEKWELYAAPDVWRLELDELDHYLYRVGNHAPIYVPATADSDLIPDLVALVERLLAAQEDQAQKRAAAERSDADMAARHELAIKELELRHKLEASRDERLRAQAELNRVRPQ